LEGVEKQLGGFQTEHSIHKNNFLEDVNKIKENFVTFDREMREALKETEDQVDCFIKSRKKEKSDNVNQPI